MKSLKYLPVILMLAPCPALASDFFFKPYVGGGYDYVNVNYKDNIDGSGINGSDLAAESIHGADIHVGARIHKYFGIEASYLWTADASKDNVLNTGINTKVNIQGAGLDAMGYLPVSDKVELIGTAGVTRLRAKINLAAGGLSGSGTEWETKGRVGAGAQYWFTDKWNVRGLVRYQGADFSGTIDNAIIASIGINYQF